MMRMLVTFLLVHFGGFNLKEKVFIAVAWLPKATVQVRFFGYHRERLLEPHHLQEPLSVTNETSLQIINYDYNDPKAQKNHHSAY